MKGGDDILRDIARLHDDMGFFLMENRAANVERGLPYPGPAARKIGRALDQLQAQYRGLVFPEDCDAGSDEGRDGRVEGPQNAGEGVPGQAEAPGGEDAPVPGRATLPEGPEAKARHGHGGPAGDGDVLLEGGGR